MDGYYLVADMVTEWVGIAGWRMRLLSGWVLLGGGYGY